MVNLLEELQDEFGLTYVFIAHDLGVVRHVSDRIAVMYLGKLVELSPAEELYARPIMPYTEALLSAVPVPDPDLAEKRERIVLEGDVPSPINPPSRLPLPPALPLRDRDLLSRSSRRSSTTATATSPPATIRSTWTRRRWPASRPRRRTRRKPPMQALAAGSGQGTRRARCLDRTDP